MHVKERGHLAGAGLFFCTTWVPWFQLRFSGFTGSCQQLDVKNFDDSFSNDVRFNKQIIKSLVFSHFLLNKIFYFCLHSVHLLIRIKFFFKKITFVICVEPWRMCFKVKWCQGIQFPHPVKLKIKVCSERDHSEVFIGVLHLTLHIRGQVSWFTYLEHIFKLPGRMDTN